MREMTKQKISTYSMKLRLYPSTEQKAAMDKIFHALHVAFNITFHHVFLKNPAVCTEPNKDGAVWPNYKKMATSAWREFLISENPVVGFAPSAALITNNGLFSTDAKHAWETRMHNIPVDPNKRNDFRFYNSKKPRRSFFVQIDAKNVIPSQDNEKVAWIKVPKVGKIKARGFNRKLWFGENGQHTYTEALQAGELPTGLSARFSKDTCGDYFVSLTFSEGKKGDRSLYLETPVAECKEEVGIDIGIKDIAILSNGRKVENKHFKRGKQRILSVLHRELSRRWGPANLAYRDYNRGIRQENRTVSDEQQQPPDQPSKRYLRSQRKKLLIQRKIVRRRDTYYHQQTAAIVRQSSLIAMESLLVSNLMKNHKLAYALADAAMSDFLAKIRYKAERYQVPVTCIGTFEPSSQLCSICGSQNPRVKNLSVRVWTCPNCGTRHDRDINAAKNILQIAITKGGVSDKVNRDADDSKLPTGKKRQRKEFGILPDKPEIVVVFSKELTRHNDPRYVIKNTKTNVIIDDAQGVGYRSASNARNCYKAKLRWTETHR